MSGVNLPDRVGKVANGRLISGEGLVPAPAGPRRANHRRDGGLIKEITG